MATDPFLASLALIDWLPNIKDGIADWLVVLFGDLLPSMDSFPSLADNAMERIAFPTPSRVIQALSCVPFLALAF